MDLFLSQLIQLGLTIQDASEFANKLTQTIHNHSPEESWQRLLPLLHHYPFSIHLLVYQTIYPTWQTRPAPAWFPLPSEKTNFHIYQLMKENGLKTYEAFHQWSTENVTEFWQQIIKKLNIQFTTPYSQLVDLTQGIESPRWLPGAKLNIAANCFKADENQTAIIFQTEEDALTKISYGELDRLSNRVANSLEHLFNPHARLAIIMPMSVHAVAIYLGMIKAGLTVVAIPDSFSADEIALRLRIAKVQGVFCQYHISHGNTILSSYEKIIAAHPPLVIVLSSPSPSQLRPQDQTWEDFLIENDCYVPLAQQPDDIINILFSSGTTGEPKAIPWTHATPIKCGSDAYLHHNLQPTDIFCWPSNLGWMMGPWLIFACLLNKATLALYNGATNSKKFGLFIQHAGVTVLGVVPTMVKSWRNTACMEGLNWQTIRLFTSTGERSHCEDMLYLMSLAHYRPIIEYCGGTEIAGAYITGSLLHPCAPAAFTTPALGIDFVLLDEKGQLANKGEAMLIPPSMGLSTTLLNKNHHLTYYADLPKLNSKIIRRHGDEIERYPNGFYRLLGRMDDTMKLSGIKISSTEIENILNRLPDVDETAAVAIQPAQGGPSLLVIYAVIKPEKNCDPFELKTRMQKEIRHLINPFFKIHEVKIIDQLPRTASNKMMRRVLREQYQSIKS